MQVNVIGRYVGKRSDNRYDGHSSRLSTDLFVYKLHYKQPSVRHALKTCHDLSSEGFSCSPYHYLYFSFLRKIKSVLGNFWNTEEIKKHLILKHCWKDYEWNIHDSVTPLNVPYKFWIYFSFWVNYIWTLIFIVDRSF